MDVSPQKTGMLWIAYLSFWVPDFHTMHSCMSSSSIPALRIIATISSRSSRAAHHDNPHPAEIALGTGIMRPGT